MNNLTVDLADKQGCMYQYLPLAPQMTKTAFARP